MRTLFLLLFFVNQVLFAMACDQEYTLQEGDSLSTIAQNSYGDSDLWTILYNHNEEKIDNPFNVPAGKTIHIPCILEKEVKPTPPKRLIKEKPTVKLAPVPEKITIEILSAHKQFPFLELLSSGQDMLTTITKEALLRLDDKRVQSSIDFIDDKTIHPTLLQKDKYDLSLGWYRPSCNSKTATSATKALCDLVYSKPLFQSLSMMYRRKNSGMPILKSKDLHGKKVCRPKGWFTFDLEEQGLIDGQTITLIRASNPEECFVNLKDGKVDFVSLTAIIGDKTINDMGIKRYVEPIDTVSTILDLCVVSHKENPDAKRNIDLFNRALKKLIQSGQLETIQYEYLKELYQ